MNPKRITLRRATQEDCRDMWLWRNHPQVRKNFFDTKRVPWQKHKNWFNSKIKDINTKIYIAEKEKNKIGIIRFETEDSFAKVSVSLNPDFFGTGLGSKIIKSGSEKFLREIKKNNPIIAEIKKDNIASQKAFGKAGYRLTKKMKEKLIYEKAKHI